MKGRPTRPRPGTIEGAISRVQRPLAAGLVQGRLKSRRRKPLGSIRSLHLRFHSLLAASRFRFVNPSQPCFGPALVAPGHLELHLRIVPDLLGAQGLGRTTRPIAACAETAATQDAGAVHLTRSAERRIQEIRMKLEFRSMTH